MSFLRLALSRTLITLTRTQTAQIGVNNVFNNTFLKPSFVNAELSKRFLSLTPSHCCEEQPPKSRKYDKPGRDRSVKISVDTSVEYLASPEYKEAYGDKFVWEGYRRVHKGGTPPKKTRKSCIRFNVVTTSSPCPICRDEYLVLDYKNLELVKQFVSPHTGEIISYSKTGVCQKQHRNLVIALERAYDLGLLEYVVPFRHYDYSLYYDKKEKKDQSKA